MADPPQFDLAAAHKYFAAYCFNSAWPLIEKSERSPEEELGLVALGHASLWHWMHRSDCTDKNLSVGHWLLSRIYATLRDAVPARRYAESCLAISQRSELDPFYLAFAYEGIARAASIAEDWATVANALQQARSLSERIEDSENRTLLLNDLATIQAHG